MIVISEKSEQRPVTNVRHTPARDKATDELNKINEKILKLRKSKEIGLEPENCKKIKVLTKQKHKFEEKLKKKILKSNQRMQKYRSRKRKKLERLNRDYPEMMRNYIKEDIKTSDDMTGHFNSLSRLALECSVKHSFHVLLFDYYCPSIGENIGERICEICGLYCSSKNNVKSHEKLHKNISNHNYSITEETGLENIDNIDINANDYDLYDTNDRITIINDLNEWLSPCFQTDFD